jgi:hypothetical protein
MPRGMIRSRVSADVMSIASREAGAGTPSAAVTRPRILQ